MKTLDDGLAEAISSLIWVAPRMQADVQELKIVCDQFTAKYGKPYAQACKENAVGTVSAKLMHKLSVQAPPKITVEKYLIEIARYYNVEYEPDPQVMSQDEIYSADNLIELAPAPPNKNDLDNMGAGGGSGGGGGFTAPPSYNIGQPQPMQYPSAGGAMNYPPPGMPTLNIAAPPPFSYNIPSQLSESPNDNNSTKGELNMFDDSAPPPYFPPDQPKVDLSQQQPPPNPIYPAPTNNPDMLDLPDLPAVPMETPLGGNTPQGGGDDDIDFDDLTKRFEALKKKK